MMPSDASTEAAGVTKGKRARTAHNERMQPGNPYAEGVDFLELAKEDPAGFGRLVGVDSSGKAVVDWKNPATQRELTRALLRRDFGLKWDMPEDKLCPPVPNRFNYICWLHELLRLAPTDRRIKGADLGVGASCIYPLLGARRHGWAFVGTDIDADSLRWAAQNVAENQLQDLVSLVQVERSDDLQQQLAAGTVSVDDTSSSAAGPILKAVAAAPGSLPWDFVMTNPPFYDVGEKIQPAEHAVCTGADNEMVTGGGEYGFVLAMIADSFKLREQVRWYTSMIGKKHTLKRLLAVLRKVGVRNVRTTRFFQGQTTRWAIAWSFTDEGIDSLTDEHKVFARHASSTAATSLRTELSVNHILATTLPDVRPETQPEDVEAWAMGELVSRIRMACESPQLKDSCSLTAVTSTGVEGVVDGAERFEINLEGSGHGPRSKRMRSEDSAEDSEAKITLELVRSADGDEVHAASLTPGLRKFWELVLADVQRTNRRWRRALQRV